MFHIDPVRAYCGENNQKNDSDSLQARFKKYIQFILTTKLVQSYKLNQ